MQRGKKKLAETTARKMVGIARQVFKRAVKAKHIAENPFADDERPTSIGNREKEYVSAEAVQQALAVLPSAEWKAVLVFARYAGMRVQSELPLLRWNDIDEQENRFAVYSPKTKRTRQVPLFPEIRRALEDLRPITGESEYVLGVLREKSNNWRTPLQKILTREGIEPWKPLFNCLRSSAEIDIAAKFGVVAATEWVGNSMQVAMKHYLSTTAADFDRAAKTGPIWGPEAAREATKQGERSNTTSRQEQRKKAEERCKPNEKRDASVSHRHPDQWTILDSNQ
jgi:integrase